MKFTHIHNHSHYSLLDGLPKIDGLIARTKEFGLDSLALTDHGTMSGIIEFYQKCKKADVKPIVGVEAYVAPNKHTDKRPRVDDKPYHLVLLAYSYEGYQNLMRLVSISHLKGYYYKPRVDKELLKKYSKGLIASTACLGGEIPKSILNDNALEKTVAKIKEHQEIFGKDNFFLEVQHHPNMPEQVKVNQGIFELGKSLDIPVIATCDTHYLSREDQAAQDVLLCIQTGKIVSDTRRMDMRDIFVYMKSPEEMAQDYPEHPEVLSNTQLIADKCNVEIPLLNKYFPAFEVESGKTADEELTDFTFRRLKEKFGVTPDNIGTEQCPVSEKEAKERIDRVNYELDTIKNQGYSTYFLIVADFINWMRQQKIVTTTRGSAAGCFVSYLIGITNLDPIAFNVPFERFLNPWRPSLPDVDIDIADNRRGEVIEYVREKYGEDKVAQICTFGTMAARGSVKDVGRALDLPYSLCDELSKMIPMGKQGSSMTIQRALDENPELKERYDKDPQVKHLFELAQKIEGCARHASVHAAGVVISPTALTDYTPLHLDKDGSIVTQYDMYSVGEDGVGLVKMDFLGIRNLSILGEAVKYIKAIHGVEIDIESVPLDDKKTFELLAAGRTMGVFQLSSEGMTQNLVALKPTNIYDIISMLALYRPGPMDSIPEYIRRKHNPELIRYPHPKLEKHLKQSLGLLVYQDDLLNTAIEMAGYTWKTVDKFRKAIGKKIPEEMAKQEKIFISGCQTHSGLSLSESEALWKLFEPFQGYGFNRAHGTSYSMISYQTAYLKAHYPAAYMAALMTAESGDLDKIADAINECEEMGMEVTLPDINESFSTFTVVKESLETDKPIIRFGLVAVKNIGENIIKAIVTERKENGKYKNLADLLYRVQDKDLNKKSVESLIKSGALDSFGDRSQMIGNSEKILAYVKEAHNEGKNGQVSLFSTMQEDTTPPLNLEPVPDIDNKQLLLWEKELLGLYVSAHPFKDFQKHIKDIAIPLGKLSGYKNATKDVTVAGLITSVRKIMTKNNEPMLFVKLEDDSASTEVVVFPKVYKRDQDIWQEDAALIIVGKISTRDSEPKILANKVFALELDKIEEVKEKLGKNTKGDAGGSYGRDLSNFGVQQVQEQKLPTSLVISLPNLGDLELQKNLKTILNNQTGNGKVILKINNQGSIQKIQTSFLVTITSALKDEIERLVGAGSVEVI